MDLARRLSQLRQVAVIQGYRVHTKGGKYVLQQTRRRAVEILRREHGRTGFQIAGEQRRVHRRHPGRIRAGDCAAFELAHRGFERANGWIAITCVDVAGALTREDLIDLLHRAVSKRGAGIDGRGYGLTFGWIAVTSVDVAGALTREDLIDLLHRAVSKRGAGIDGRGYGLTFGWWLAFTGMDELGCDVAFFSLVRHRPSQISLATVAEHCDHHRRRVQRRCQALGGKHTSSRTRANEDSLFSG